MRETVPFRDDLAEILNEGRPLSHRRLARLSNLNGEELAAFREAWQTTSPERRLRVVSSLLELTEDNTDLNFREVFFVCLRDDQPRVRAAAIEGLWDDESRSFLEHLLVLASDDPSPAVRSQALLALTRFTYLIETTDYFQEFRQTVHDLLLAVWRDGSAPVEVRRRAIEAVSYLSDSAEVEEAIAESYRAAEREMRVSAIHAMGHHMGERWLPAIAQELGSEDPEMRYEAAQASGEMANPELVPYLAPLLDDEDHEVARAAIWALGEIGGAQARRLLERCLLAEEDDIREAAEEALGTLRFFEDPLRL
ncbi:MAG: HEAT repeat domain-containing protein [Chloroflexia bacterium]